MRYVVAGYVAVLGILFLYALQLLWRRRRLTRIALRIDSSPPDPGPSAAAVATGTADGRTASTADGSTASTGRVDDR